MSGPTPETPGFHGAHLEPPRHGGVADAAEDAAELPDAAELNARLHDGSGNAVSAQPFDTDPTDLADARERVVWDADANAQD